MSTVSFTEHDSVQPEATGPKIKKRTSSAVALLNFLWTGLGHVYIGEARRGIILLMGEMLLTGIFYVSTISFSISGLLFALTVLIAYKLFVIIDSVHINRRKGAFELKRYNRLLVYNGFIILITTLSLIVGATLSRPKAFKIPGPSMSPTFLIGDHILIDRWAYGTSGPQRGDLIVFRYPRNRDLDFIKRCVAVEGDLLEIRDKVLFIDGIRMEETFTTFFDAVSTMKGRDNFGPYTIPPGKIFTLGDNRDNSNDSRFWGPVDIEDVKGKVKITYWSWDKENRAVRWKRIGRKMN